MEMFYFILGIILGIVLAWGALYTKNQAKNGLSLDDIESKYIQKEIYIEQKKAIERLADDIQDKQFECTDLNKIVASQARELEHLRKEIIEKAAQWQNQEANLKTSFENLASKLLEEKSQRFTAQNQENIQNLLLPLNEKIQAFEQKINSTHVEDTKQRTALYEQIRQLSELNQEMSHEAAKLTKALKGDSKTQGNWGEMILETILEKSGLVRDREYSVQESFTNEQGRRFQPDIVINLPDSKHIIVDAKVSLTAYERYSSADNKLQQEQYLKEHILSVRKHIKELSQKAYHTLWELRTPDFVLLFIPIESAFSLAAQYDKDMIHEAFNQNIVIVSPTTLLATLRTVTNIWRQEQQTRNAYEIARQSGILYDKFVTFIQDMELIKDKMQQTNKAYESAMLKLQLGRGSLIQRAEQLRQLGAKTSKTLPNQYLDNEEPL